MKKTFTRDFFVQAGKKGGLKAAEKPVTEKKRKAVSENLKKARAKRWAKKLQSA